MKMGGVVLIGATLSASLAFGRHSQTMQTRPPAAPAAMQADVDALVRAASQVTGTWTKQPPPRIREADAVARHGRPVAPLLIALLPDGPARESALTRWKVAQQATLALSVIFGEGSYCGRIFCDGDDPRRIANVKQAWLHTIAADQELRALSPSELLDRFTREPIFWRQFQIGQALASASDRSVVGALERLLNVEDRHVRGNVAFVLGRLGDPRGFTTLAEILLDTAPRPHGQGIPGGSWTLAAPIRADRYYAAHVLGALQDPRGVEALIPLLADRDAGAIVPWALARIGDPRAIGPLVRLLEQDDPLSRILAILALETLGAGEALPALQSLLQDTRPSNFGELTTVADAARHAIAAISVAR